MDYQEDAAVRTVGNSVLEDWRREDPRAIAALRKAVGSLCELRSQENKLVFLGRVHRFDGTSITLISSTGRELPPVIFNTAFKLIVRIPNHSAQVWRGQVCGSTPTMWKLDHLICFHYDEQRSAFRQPLSTPAKMARAQDQSGLPIEDPTPCRVLDISLGGLQLSSRERLTGGTWVQISDCRLSPKTAPFLFVGQVCWTDLAGSAEFLYGVHFAPMRSGAQDRLCSAIFDIQRRDLQAKRPVD